MTTSLPEVARVTFEGTFNDRPWVNVLHFANRDASAMSAAELLALCNALSDISSHNDSWVHLLTRMDSGLTLTTVKAVSLSIASPVEAQVSVARAGGSSGPDAPPLLAACVAWRTSIALRKYRGRSFLSGVNTGMFQTDSDRLDLTFQANLQTNAQAFVDAWAANVGVMFCILSSVDRAADITVPYSEVLTASVNPLFATQRRRRG